MVKALIGGLLLLAGSAAVAQGSGVSLHAFECGTAPGRDVAPFSDAYGLNGVKRDFIAGCYLIRHPKGVLLWDAGLNPNLIGAAPAGGWSLKQSIPDRLKTLGLTPSAVTHIGISHYHADHSGGASAFPAAELLIGKGDWDALQAMKPDMPPAAQLAPWLTGGGKVTPVAVDKDVFGDGSVVMVAMPGHTPGHSALIVRLASGPLLLSGDQFHFRENREARGVPSFNTNRADTLASHDRFEEIARNLKARVIIQHDPRDMALLPAFPAALR